MGGIRGPSGPAHEPWPRRLKAFAAKAPQREAEARRIIKTAPGVGTVTAEVVLSELGDVESIPQCQGRLRLRGDGTRGPAKRRQEIQGSGNHQAGLGAVALGFGGSELGDWSARVRNGNGFYERIGKRTGGKRAIVAVARKLLCVLYAMLKTTTPYRIWPT